MSSSPTKPWLLVLPGLFLMAWGGNHFTPLLAMYHHVLHLAAWQTNILLVTYVLGLIPGLLIASSLSNQYGRKPIAALGLIASLIGNLLIGLAFGSFTLINIGRVFAGFGVGVGMSVGTTWMKELSTRAWDPTANVAAGAKRPSMTLSLGFGIGAGVTGLLAQFLPAPTITPYLVFAVLCALAFIPTFKAPETVGAEDPNATSLGPWYRQLKTPSAARGSFWAYIAPAAPWVFGVAAIAYGLIPQVMEPVTGDYVTLYATVAALATLVLGTLIQPWALRMDQRTNGRGPAISMVINIIGILIAALSVTTISLPLSLIAIVVLGISYGINMVCGLARVQAFAPVRDLAGLTGIFYSLTYLGFTIPTILSALLPVMSYTTSFIWLAVLAALCLIPTIIGRKKLGGYSNGSAEN